MSFSINQVVLVGNISRVDDPRYSTNGNAIMNFSLATNRSVKKNEEWVDVPTFHRVVVFGKIAEFCGKTLTKGMKVYVDGRIDTRTYEDKNGDKKTVTEVIATNVIPFSNPKSGGSQPKKAETKEETFNEAFPDKDPEEKLDEDVDPEIVEYAKDHGISYEQARKITSGSRTLKENLKNIEKKEQEQELDTDNLPFP